MAEPTHLILRTSEQTAELARALAPLLGSGDVLLLSGSIGAGKTHFARALIQHRLARTGRVEDVPSPTFTLVQVYDDDLVEIWHADLYRLSSPDDVTELGLDEAFETAIVLVEWPDRLGSDAPGDACRIDFEYLPEGRSVKISWSDPRRDEWLSVFHAHS